MVRARFSRLNFVCGLVRFGGCKWESALPNSKEIWEQSLRIFEFRINGGFIYMIVSHDTITPPQKKPEKKAKKKGRKKKVCGARGNRETRVI